jgi:predicted transposase/invertase (TIGR01784 family)
MKDVLGQAEGAAHIAPSPLLHTTGLYLNLFTDFGFKKVFGEAPNKHLLVSFLNTLLPERHQIASLEYTKSEFMGRTEADRRAVIDLTCVSNRGEFFIIELQKAPQHYFKDRSIYYSTFPIAEQAKKGEWDYRLSHVYTVGILNFRFDEDKNNIDVVHHIQLKNQHNQVFYDKLTYIYLTIPNFLKTEAELVTDQDKWFYLFSHLHHLDHIPAGFREQVFVDLFNISEVAKLSKENFAAYNDSLKQLRDLSNVLDYAKETSWSEGKEEGLVEGFIEGEKIGYEKASKEAELRIAEEKRAIAKHLLNDLTDSQIAAITGLTVAEISALR